jgi:hypothetical protein
MGKDITKAKGGHARAEVLSPERRREIAQKAASERWNSGVPQTDFIGDFKIGSKTISAAVLPNGKRLLTQGTFLQAIGRSRTVKAGTGVLSTDDGIPPFLSAEVVKPFISEDILVATTPVFYRTKSGRKMVGYDAQLLPMVAEVYLKMRDEFTSNGKSIPSRYAHIIQACDLVMRALAHIGIVALVDEATGYQDIRDRLALQAILDAYLLKEFAAWAKRFPDEFYKEIFRLRKWEWKGMKINRPQVVATYTKDIVYQRLAPGILDELEKKNPIENGKRKVKHFQFLTEDVGHPALAQHLYAVIGLMRVSNTWEEFKTILDRAYPKYKNSRQLLLFPM